MLYPMVKLISYQTTVYIYYETSTKHWLSHGVTGGHVPLPARSLFSYRRTQNSAKMLQKRHFHTKKCENFSGGEAQRPPQIPSR